MKKLCSLLLAVIIVVGFALPAFAKEQKFHYLESEE